MLKKEKFVKPEKVDEVVKKHDLNYLLLLGKRSNGKSSAVKSLLLQRFLLTGQVRAGYEGIFDKYVL